MSVIPRVTGLDRLKSRAYHKKWSRTFVNEQAKTTRVITKLVKNNPFSDFGSEHSEIFKMLKRWERNFW